MRQEAVTVIRLDTGSGRIPGGVRTSLSTHGMGLIDALTLAETVGRLPRILVLGLEAHNTEVGSGLSSEVSSHLEDLVDGIADEVSTLMGTAKTVTASRRFEVTGTVQGVGFRPFVWRLAERHGLSPVFETARMYTGDAPEIDLAGIYGVATFELG